MIFRGISTLWTLQGVAARDGRRVRTEDLSPVKKAAMVCEKGRIQWVGPERLLPKSLARQKHSEMDLKGGVVLPSFIDCHTHLIFAGHRATEFEWRNTGMTYQQIAAQGGGILSTMKATRRASPAQLLNLAQARVDGYLAQGVTTVEVKSGYALNLKDELKCLKVAQSLKKARIIPTFLGAHARPPEFATNIEYLQYLTEKILPLVKKQGLAERVDVFLEKGFFEREESETYLRAAQALGFEVVIHADQLSLSGGSVLGAELGALSVDHAIRLDPPSVEKLAKSKTTAVLLPSADLFLRCPYPPARDLIEAGARVALATDFNPGSSPSQDLQLMGLLARLEMKMTLPEVLAAATYNAAVALGRGQELGSLEPGKAADFFSMSADLDELFMSVGRRFPDVSFSNGRKVYARSI